MEEVLRQFGISGTFLSAILGLHTQPSARIWTSGIVSSPFKIPKGTIQGCPLSPLIFAMILEPLAQAIRSDPVISGIKIGDTEHKIGLGLYANNVIIALTNPKVSLPAVQHILDSFSSISLYKLNHSKSLMLNVGLDLQTTNIISAESPFAWATNSFLPYLGIKLTFPSHILLQTNFEDLIGKLMCLSKELSRVPAS